PRPGRPAQRPPGPSQGEADRLVLGLCGPCPDARAVLRPTRSARLQRADRRAAPVPRRISPAVRPANCDPPARNRSAWQASLVFGGGRQSVIRLQSPSSSPGSRPLPRFEHHDARHEPTLIAAARSQMTASSPRGTFSQAELTAVKLVTRRIQVGRGCRGGRPLPARAAVSPGLRLAELAGAAIMVIIVCPPW